MKRLLVATLAVAALAAPCSGALAATGRLTLTEALRRADDPSVSAADARIDAADANIRQSRKRPNPSLGVEVENFGGSGETRGFSDVETTLSYEQPVELGGKRSARVTLAERQRDASAARALIARLDLFEAVQRAFTAAALADAEIGLAEERLKIARELDAELGRRIARARDPEFAGARARTRIADAELSLRQAQLSAEAARARLASYWGGAGDFVVDARGLETPRAPVLDASTLTVGADVRLLEAERSAAAANVDVERSKAVPDPTFGVGIRHFNRNDDVAIVISGSIPLNVFNDNSGAVDRASSERRAAELDLASYRIQRERELQRLSAAMAINAAEVRQIDETILPAAGRAVSQVREGFARGAFSYLDVIEAQNSLTDARARRLDALRRFHDDQASFDRLLGTHIELAATGAKP